MPIWQVQARLRTTRPGFSAPELIVAVMIAALLSSIAVPQISRHTSRRAANNARDAFIAAASQARAAAIRAGEDVRMQVDPATGRVVTSLVRNGSQLLEPLDLQAGTIRGEMIGSSGFALCYVPRGFGRPCGADPDSIIGFVSPQGRDTAWARVDFGRVSRR